MKEQRYVVIDIETTGNSPKKGDKIIQVAAVTIENGEIVDRYMSFVNPMQEIPPFIEQLTGISNHMVEDAPTFGEIAEELHNMLTDAFFVAHNVYFDLSFLQEEFKSYGYYFSGPILDTVELTRMAFPTEKSYKLSDLSDEFNMLHVNPHRADSDAEATALLLLHIFKKLNDLPIITLQQLIKLAGSFISDAEEILEELLSKKLITLREQGNPDVEIVRTLAIKKQNDTIEPEGKSVELEPDTILNIFMNGRESITKVLPTFHVRSGQLKMMNEVLDAFSTHQHSMIEAGTGSGKTIGYLVPALIHSIKEKRPLIVSTHTNHLQTQILEKEIPFLQKVLPFPFTATILKGQRHYLCLQKFEQSLKDLDDNYDFILAKAQILIWLTQTETGDVDELNLPSGGRTLWENLHVDNSSFHNNPFSSICFYQKARKKASEANIIITNHAMLLSDVEREQKILPDYQEVIVDEAHHFQHVATEQLGIKLHYLELNYMMNSLGFLHTNGLLKKFIQCQQKFHLESSTFSQKLEKILMELQEETQQFFSGLHAYVLKRKKDSFLNRTSYRLQSEKENNRTWNSILELANRIQFMIHDLLKLMETELAKFDKISTNELSITEKLTIENMRKVIVKMNVYKKNIEFLFFEEYDSIVKWIEIESKGAKNAVYIYAQPVQVSEYLADKFFAHVQSAVLTSATLTVKKSFSYFIHNIGLADFFPKQVVLDSSFDYEKQVKLFVPTDMPVVNEVSIEEYSEAIAAHIGTVAQISNGKMLVLFTSYEMLRKTYQIVKEDVTLEDFAIMGQGTGSGSRSRLTKNFKQFDKAILLGTSSFWEGVDFPGEDLKALMIVRLPFASPDDPIVAATSEYMEEQGANSFYDYSLPEAILRFKQGFGRLIRHEDDRGILFVLDNRIITSRYGKDFLASIPSIDIVSKPMHHLTHSIDDWISNKKGG